MKGVVREVLSRLSSSPDFTVIVMASAATALSAALALTLLARRRRKTPEEIERLRRLAINQHGRVTYGQIVDLLEPQPGKKGARLVVFKYEVGGVKYDAAQDISALPTIVAQARQAIGQMARLKYESDRPTNSILACEEWSGLLEFSPPRTVAAQSELKSEAGN